MYPQRPTFATDLRSFATAEGLSFADVLSAQDIATACQQEDVHFGQGGDDVYTPAVTLWAFLTQCLRASKSCVAAVARVLAFATASLLGAALGPCKGKGTGETELFRTLLEQRQSGISQPK